MATGNRIRNWKKFRHLIAFIGLLTKHIIIVILSETLLNRKNTLGLPQTIRDGEKRRGRCVKVLNLVKKITYS